VRIVAAVLSVLWIVLSGTLWPAGAWNDTGHQVVALIAWDNLPPEPRSKLVAMMRRAEPATRLPSLFPEDKRAMEVRAREFFRRAATWPDLIRSVPELHHPTWHHRDFYWRQDKGRAIDLPDLQVHPENLLERLQHFKKLLANPTAPAHERAIGIAWVLHLVGDVHQPLHSTTRVGATDLQGDNGGNNVKLSDPSKELHAFWDGLPGDSSNVTDVITYGKTLTAADPLLAKKSDASDWIKESFDIAQTTVYSGPIGTGDGPFAITQAYKDNAQKIAAERVELAGERLANLINDELK